jgi:hypothetical protein
MLLKDNDYPFRRTSERRLKKAMIVTLCIARRQFAADRGIATEQTHGAVIRSSLNQIARNHCAAGRGRFPKRNPAA